MPLDITRMKAPFPPDKIHWRVGATTQDKKRGLPLAYIDARDVMERLDDVVGPENWQCRYPHAGDKVCCDIGILVSQPTLDALKPEIAWVWKADGAGDTDYEGAKGSFSDAFKRAAVRWGIGRYLYDLKSPWVRIEQRGKTYVIPDEELTTLRRFLEGKSFTKTEPANSKDPNWKGPLGKVELQGELKALAAGIGEAPDPETLDTLLEEYGEVWKQALHDTPGWINGNGMLPEFVPLQKRLDAKRSFLASTQNLNAG